MPTTEEKTAATSATADAKAPSKAVTTTAAATPDEAPETHGGKTTIAEAVVTKIASLAAREVDGVDSLGGAISGAVAGVVGRVRGSEHRTAGVGVEVGTRQAAVDLTMKVRYPYPIHEVADTVRQNVIDRIEAMTGLEVVEVNIAVTDLAFAGEDESDIPSDRVA